MAVYTCDSNLAAFTYHVYLYNVFLCLARARHVLAWHRLHGLAYCPMATGERREAKSLVRPYFPVRAVQLLFAEVTAPRANCIGTPRTPFELVYFHTFILFPAFPVAATTVPAAQWGLAGY